jgi:hypothetical protein
MPPASQVWPALGRPLYFPSLLALAMPSRCRSSMISRSQVATPAWIASFDVGLLSPSRGAVSANTQRNEEGAGGMVGEWLKQIVGGFFNYHAVPTNGLRRRGANPIRRRVPKLHTTIATFVRQAEGQVSAPAGLLPGPALARGG